ncbi:MAG: hypothetical protein ACREHG_04245 [Candidatus Saccharimonadales bacterium]
MGALSIIGIIAGTIVSIGIIFGFLWRHLIRAIVAQVRIIEHEVTPNSGTTNTLGDRMIRLESRQLEFHREYRREFRELHRMIEAR